MTERFAETTTVRRPRRLLKWAISLSFVALFFVTPFFHRHVPHAIGTLLGMSPALIPIVVLLMRAFPKIASLAVEATPDGLTLGREVIERKKLDAALLVHEGARTWVRLHGGATTIDVEVRDEEEGERLCSALALDAKSATVEFVMMRHVPPPKFRLQIAAALVATIVGAIAGHAIHAAFAPLFGALGFFGTFLVVYAVMLSRSRTKLSIGADGIVLERAFRQSDFVPHGDVASVVADGPHVVFTSTRDETMAFQVRSELPLDLARQAQSIAWRIDKALQAHRTFAGDVHATALGRGDRTAREWIDHLRRIGQGANATFRDVMVTRDQLLALVESTTAPPIDRLAAMVALRDGLTDDERPRVRVATDRCAEPAMRDWMVRVASASDEELMAAFEDADALSDEAGDAARR